MAKKSVKANLSVQDKFTLMREDMNKSLIERESEIDIVLTALICKEHPLFVGPPGTAKSLLCDSLLSWIVDQGASKFGILFNKSTAMEEVFGAVDVMSLKSGVYRRITTNRLPEAHIVFADEIWKGSSAILNAMLKVMNERLFDNGSGLQSCPLRVCVAASNEWPEADLGALFDRFLFRKIVKPVSRSNRHRLLWERNHSPSLRSGITLDELDEAWDEASDFEFTDACKSTLDTILDELNRESIFPGDRRMYKALNACQAYAFLMGDCEVHREHLEILQHILWESPDEQPAKCAQIVMRNASPQGAEVMDLLLQADDVISKNKPTDAVPKLQDIKKRLDVIAQTYSRAHAAGESVQKLIKQTYNRVIGVE